MGITINDLKKKHAKYLMRGMYLTPKPSVTPGIRLKAPGKKGGVRSVPAARGAYSAAPSKS